MKSSCGRILACFVILAPAPAAAEPLKTMDDVGKAIQSCWAAPAGTDGSSVTLSFSFRRDGTLIGRPRTTAVNVKGDDQARKSFVDAAVAAVDRCMPLDFASPLASGIGGQVFTVKFASPEACPDGKCPKGNDLRP
ncbi:hypothetical protein M1D80_13690 [Phyllobacteriaceae bacterium JZ32]